mmetsp:Transcript_8325/g.8488  ORF Transcript_8325/g.8488 Transcript_8325/m.8488 type:complete len:133 (+) Transcript_8325:143-541(+)
MLQSAEILLIEELYSHPSIIGKYVRITGALDFYDNITNTAKCTHKDRCIYIDMELADAKSLSPSCQCQCLGQICSGFENGYQKTFPGDIKPQFYLKAKIARNVDGLDMELFEHAIMTRRAFMEEHFANKSTT